MTNIYSSMQCQATQISQNLFNIVDFQTLNSKQNRWNKFTDRKEKSITTPMDLYFQVVLKNQMNLLISANERKYVVSGHRVSSSTFISTATSFYVSMFSRI